jgi:uncharacterized protein (UPF0335 family)
LTFIKTELSRLRDKDDQSTREIASLRLKLLDKDKEHVQGTSERVELLEETVINLNEELDQTLKTAAGERNTHAQQYRLLVMELDNAKVLFSTNISKLFKSQMHQALVKVEQLELDKATVEQLLGKLKQHT